MQDKKQIKVKYSPVFEEQLKKLREVIKEKNSKFHKQLLTAIEREKDNLFIDPHRGIQIKKKQIPKEYIIKYGVTNLWKINLPDFWRMLYTITGNELEIISILLEFMDHNDYDKLFGYRKK
ncbi:type II toxin-antitoxin system RelE/ParE family toxin [Candidatus Woesearchaeota archaeon]|nr:type II toxin-antitoxin system RelE/ParE family toxin [Candidatus Woesearchaeota archaeon]